MNIIIVDKTTNQIINWISDNINKNSECVKISLQKITNIYNMNNKEKISIFKIHMQLVIQKMFL